MHTLPPKLGSVVIIIQGIQRALKSQSLNMLQLMIQLTIFWHVDDLLRKTVLNLSANRLHWAIFLERTFKALLTTFMTVRKLLNIASSWGNSWKLRRLIQLQVPLLFPYSNVVKHGCDSLRYCNKILCRRKFEPLLLCNVFFRCQTSFLTLFQKMSLSAFLPYGTLAIADIIWIFNDCRHIEWLKSELIWSKHNFVVLEDLVCQAVDLIGPLVQTVLGGWPMVAFLVGQFSVHQIS